MIEREKLRALAAKKTTRRASKEKASKASEMADSEIDNLVDKSQSSDEQLRRKKRLIQGPREFRGIRVDQPKRK
jgi:hypothetical protein